MATFGELVDEIELDLSASVGNLLEDEIELAINRAVEDYQNERTDFNESRTTFSSVALQAEYPRATFFPNVLTIDKIQYLFGGHLYRLERQSYEWYTEALVNQSAQVGPSNYYTWYDETLFLYPQPDSVTSVTISGVHKLITDGASSTVFINSSDTNAWLQGQALQMIKARAKADIMINRGHNPQMAAAMDQVATDYQIKLRGDRDRISMATRIKAFHSF